VDEEGKYIDEFQWWYEDLGISRWKLDYVNDSKDEVKKYLSRKCTIINASAVVFENRKEIRQYLSKLKDFLISNYSGSIKLSVFHMMFIKTVSLY
jgi:hypothetical protein